MKKLFFLFINIFVVLGFGQAQAQLKVQRTLSWASQRSVFKPTEESPARYYWSFGGASFSGDNPSLPMATEVFALPNFATATVRLEDAQYEPIDLTDITIKMPLTREIVFRNEVQDARGVFTAKVEFIPIRKTSIGYERLRSYTLVLDYQVIDMPKSGVTSAERGGPVTNSNLKDGDLYKIAIGQTGVYKLDYNFLKTTMKIDVDKIDPRKIQVLGHAGGMLPEPIAQFRYNDAVEQNIEVVGESDGKFDAQDYILFYAVGVDKWSFDKAKRIFTMAKNIYDDKSYYFLKIGNANGKRIATESNTSNSEYTSSEFDDFQHFEEDKVNLLNYYTPTQGSGKAWFGDRFTPSKKEIAYNGKFNFPNIATNAPAQIRGSFASRSGNGNDLDVVFDGNSFPVSFSSVSLGDVEGQFADISPINESFTPVKKNIDVTLRFSTSGDFEGWADYLEIQARRKMIFEGPQMTFRDTKTLTYAASTFEVSGVNASHSVWEISNPSNANKPSVNLAGDKLSFVANTKDTLREYITFVADAALKPVFVEKTANQNLHNLNDVDMVIVYHPDFEAEAKRLASHRNTFSLLKTVAVPVTQVYNEFSSGAFDPTAIRDFAKNIYDQNPKFSYLLLVGDGSFNYKSIGVVDASKNKTFIPVYETNRSLDPIRSFPSDDYYGLLSNNEGYDLFGALDIAVGRLPANSLQALKAVVDKIIRYDLNPASLGDYRNRVTFVGDDEDGSAHTDQADKLGTDTQGASKIFNINKVYIDAYPQISTPGGQRCPDATQGINNNIFNGTLVMNYVGHGGPSGWSQERILIANQDVPTWNNKDKLPLFITATCSFGGYDDPDRVTAGEQILLKENGGSVALFSTVRAVYSNDNNALTDAVFKEIYVKGNNKRGRAFGDILRSSKNKSATSSENNRKFALLGDPSQQLALPHYDIKTTKINGKTIVNGKPDTVKALQKVTIEAAVLDDNGQVLTSFNGIAYPTIYDKEIDQKTLGQDGTPVITYKIQKNILFRGTSSVKNGIFSFSCVLPKDINYDLGLGKISYYAQNGKDDAAGADVTNLVIGGTYSLTKDDMPPKVQVLINNEDFIRGGITNQNPTLFVKLSDDIGLNVSGTSVGHDFTAILDGNPQNTYRLNNFFESAVDDPTRGAAKYPLYRLAAGTHTVKVKAWDIANNSAEGETEFVVESSAQAALEHILNYPNPFTTATQFQFDHNFVAPLLNVQVKVYTISGKLVKVIEEQVNNTGRVAHVKWDGRDDVGDDLAKGVYLYRINVKEEGENAKSVESNFEKLVILK